MVTGTFFIAEDASNSQEARLEPAVEDPKRRRLASDASGIRPTVNTNKPRSHADVDSSIIAFIVSVALFVGGW